MSSHTFRLASVAAGLLTAIFSPPCWAGWGADLERSVVSSFVHQAANRLIRRTFDEIDRQYPAPRPAPSPQNSAVTHIHKVPVVAHRSATAYGASSAAPKGNYFIPPPPPYPVVYPGATASKGSSDDTIVPPPPDAPSLWEDPQSSPKATLVPPPPPLSIPAGSSGHTSLHSIKRKTSAYNPS